MIANRIILFEPDWNPSTDQQTMGRVHRTGQKREVHVYRLITTGTIEEKILQRQIAKLKLSDNVINETTDENTRISSGEENSGVDVIDHSNTADFDIRHFSKEDLRSLLFIFSFISYSFFYWCLLFISFHVILSISVSK